MFGFERDMEANHQRLKPNAGTLEHMCTYLIMEKTTLLVLRYLPKYLVDSNNSNLGGANLPLKETIVTSGHVL